jgi:hypothetical protein
MYKKITICYPTVLAALIVVGMMFLVPTIPGKALAAINAVARGTCGTQPCFFDFKSKSLEHGQWVTEPTESGTLVQWSTKGKSTGGEEAGSVTYDVKGLGLVVMKFKNPTIGFNSCSIVTHPDTHQTCMAGSGQIADFTYTLKGNNPTK